MPRYRVWFTTKIGFERFVDVEAKDSGKAKLLARKQVPRGSEWRYTAQLGEAEAELSRLLGG